MKKATWQVAELLEEICKNADAYSVNRRHLGRFLQNTQTLQTATPCQISTNPARHSITATYMIAVNLAMKDVEGTAKEVVELVRTGLAEGQSIELTQYASIEVFALTQITEDQQYYDDFVEMDERLWAGLKARFSI